MSRTPIFFASLLLISADAFAWGDGCAFSANRTQELDAKGLAALELQARAGDLAIAGDAKLSRIELQGKACASSQALLDQIQFSQQRTGDRQLVTTQMPETGGWNEQATMDLVVRMPATLHLELRDSSGDIRIQGIASLDATDTSGDLNAEEIGGDVRLHDSSGDLNISAIGGTVTVTNDSSGDISISNVRGDAIVQNDSSGDIHLEQITGNGHVKADTSGDIGARNIAQNFTVDHDTSGDIQARDIQGRTSLPVER